MFISRDLQALNDAMTQQFQIYLFSNFFIKIPSEYNQDSTEKYSGERNVWGF